MLAVVALAAAAVCCHGASWLADRRGVQRVRRELGGLDLLEGVAVIERIDGAADSRRLTFSASLTGLGIWLEILAMVGFAIALDALVASLAAAMLVGVRMRAVQEVGHTLVHVDSLPARLAADLLALVPLGRPRAPERFQRHVKEHHAKGTLRPGDPHVDEVIGWMRVLSSCRTTSSGTRSLSSGMLRLFRAQFSIARLSTAVGVYLVPRSRHLFDLARPLVLIAPALLVAYVDDSVASGIVLWLLPLLVVYPLLSWVSELVEHRWNVEPPGRKWSHHEVRLGQVLLATNATWLPIRTMQPYGEQFHLLHSVNWSLGPRQLRATHRELAARCPEYQARFTHFGPALRSVLVADADEVLVRIESPVGG